MRTVFVLLVVVGLVFLSACGGDKPADLMGQQDVQKAALPGETKDSPPVNVAPPVPDYEKSSVPEGETVFEQSISFDSFPKVLSTELEQGVKYRVSFEADNNIKMVVYNKQRYSQWRETRVHTISKATTQKGSVCCSKAESFVVDINAGEGGEYYFVFDGSMITDEDNLPKQGSIRVSKMSNI